MARLSSLLVLALLQRARSAGEANPPKCAGDITSAIEDFTEGAADITYATSDCTPPGLDELDCSADIIDTVEQFAGVAAAISASTKTCGGINNACASEIAQTIEDTSDSAEYFVAAAADCTSTGDPLVCVADMTEAINSITSVAADIDSALEVCNPAPIETYDQPDMSDMDSYNAAVASLGEDDPVSGAVERRLAEAVDELQFVAEPVGVVTVDARGWEQYLEDARKHLAEFKEEVKTLGRNADPKHIADVRKQIASSSSNRSHFVNVSAALERRKARGEHAKARRERMAKVAEKANSVSTSGGNSTGGNWLVQ